MTCIRKKIRYSYRNCKSFATVLRGVFMKKFLMGWVSLTALSGAALAQETENGNSVGESIIPADIDTISNSSGHCAA